ncbi:YraN family protein [Oceanicoccus sp. KOV_DT_Chl]|uniref:YraN family protein n=1 Tax=Oceanicoccus sp. KOV_DT_Chl TaxID=1904639 RepID=UPI000C7C1EBB|nr:YraN family protein [Oceanicoccus sp. KOV_DT_Chl]
MLERWRTKRKQDNRATSNTSTTGAHIEQQTEHWLTQQGLSSLHRNYRCREGEIDLIMRDAEHLVFVEVRYRKRHQYGDGLESVDWRKQQKLQKAAAHYLLRYPQYNNYPCRFDVVAVCPQNKAQQATNNNAKLHWSWIKNAFSG